MSNQQGSSFVGKKKKKKPKNMKQGVFFLVSIS